MQRHVGCVAKNKILIICYTADTCNEYPHFNVIWTTIDIYANDVLKYLDRYVIQHYRLCSPHYISFKNSGIHIQF